MRFSNPNVTLEGKPSGDALADNAKWIREQLPAYAKFRASQDLAISTPPVAAPTNPSPNVPTFDPSGSGQELIASMDGGFSGAPGKN